MLHKVCLPKFKSIGTSPKQSIAHSLSTSPSKEIHWSVPYYKHPRLFSDGKKG